MSDDATFDPIGKARERRRLLDLVPEPSGKVYDDDARAALIRAGVSEDDIAILEDAARETAAVPGPR